jgi:hypothetical protein
VVANHQIVISAYLSVGVVPKTPISKSAHHLPWRRPGSSCTMLSPPRVASGRRAAGYIPFFAGTTYDLPGCLPPMTPYSTYPFVSRSRIHGGNCGKTERGTTNEDSVLKPEPQSFKEYRNDFEEKI